MMSEDLVLRRFIDDARAFEVHRTCYLHYAAETNREDVVDLLIAQGGNVNSDDGLGTRPLHIAASVSHTICQKLLSAKATVDARDRDGFTPLRMAVSHNAIDTAALLLAHKASPDSTPLESTNTILHNAVVSSTTQIIKTLLDAAANVNARNFHLETPLDLAGKRSRDVVDLLLWHGANPFAGARRPPAVAAALGRRPCDPWFCVHPRLEEAAVAMMLCRGVVDREHPFHAFPPELITQLLHEMSCLFLFS